MYMSKDADPNFDPTDYHMKQSHYFDDLIVGERFIIPPRTLGDASFSAFVFLVAAQLIELVI